jgi:flagellar motor switch protein FliN/FliY
MSDGSLSQEEIDALLQGADDLSASLITEEPAAVAGLSEDERNEFRALAEEIAQSMGMTLSTITGKSAEISDPQVDILTKDAFIPELKGQPVQITADYTGGSPGKHTYVISEEAAKQVSALMMAQDEGELTEMALSALTEGFSQMSGAALNIVEEKTGNAVKTDALMAVTREDPVDLELPEGNFVRVRYDFVSNGNSSVIDEIFDLSVVKSIADGVLAKKGVGVQSMAAPQTDSSKAFQPGIQQAAPAFSTGSGSGFGQSTIGVQPVQFAPLSSTQQSGITGNIGLLMDVSMQLTVELGRTKMLIKDILGMGEGTIVELDKLAGEPVDLLVNGKLIAKGEVVVIDENFGVRVTDIISPMERISNLE